MNFSTPGDQKLYKYNIGTNILASVFDTVYKPLTGC